MPPEVLKFLHDIQQACGLIQQFTVDKNADDYRGDAQLRSAVERQFITIGGALQQAIRVLPDLADSITETRRIVNFRNVMVHGYARVVPDTVWGVVEKDRPVLDAQVQSLIAAGSKPA
jgi:uncharacterized protein with HEPN domain